MYAPIYTHTHGLKCPRVRATCAVRVYYARKRGNDVHCVFYARKYACEFVRCIYACCVWLGFVNVSMFTEACG